ncbi:Short-chain dehydrogenase/reductase SDR [Fusarium oxysporum f. sp. vasinfectum]|uniref:Alcohol dehydrogenase n=1 Tax=Fusarium oxysporum f. sp. vasinfectum 25433 TaxID=1089449 RepID=X0LJV1_FUSOX|nr:alcohol dehydrogenase [Fusarium oxysporum f. sp. vasinfectum 25433]KAK2675035.1 Short-chain dehydrogenase/reductase SDR [Fusarium oxysporum f. sp. vasinfectum]KAK2931467.1 Short-chain dehydrogenase/reductase SDR [Fusarium oxysporum f. sp. vasinfectum]
MSAHDSSLRETNWPALASYVSTHNDTYPFIDPSNADLSGKSVLITGASKGIGKATAFRFAMAGCSKIILAARSDMADVEAAVIDAAKKANRPQPLIHSISLDTTSEGSVSAAAEAIKEILGGSLDILINNAGCLEKWKPVAESDPSEWWWTWEVTMKGTYLSARYFIPLLLKSSTKTIINVSSVGAQIIVPGASAYQTSKFALCRFTEFIDKEYYEQGLVAISIHPGGIKTELALNMPPAMHSHLNDTVELAADTMVWLSRERRDWLSGRFITVNWDMEELENKKKEILGGNLLRFRMMI